jgi:SAM-dependent methyltransferase
MQQGPDQDAAVAREHNRRAWDARVANRGRFTKPAEDADFVDPLRTVDAAGWLGDSIAGKRLLCLGAGGGKHSVIYAAAGALVTVVDISPGMLALDREVATERKLPIRTVEASMDDLGALATSSFDLVVQPVSTCYVPDVLKVYREIARVTAAGGLYVSQHKQPGSLQISAKPADAGYTVQEPYYRAGPLPPVAQSMHREEGTLEFLHRWEDLLGGLCRAGFVIEDLLEPFHADPKADAGAFGHRSCYVPPYVRIKARRVSGGVTLAKPSVWTPT